MTDPDRQLPRGAFTIGLGQAAFLLTSFLLYAVLARLLPPSSYGLFRVSMTVLVWVEITVNNGVPLALQRFLPDASLSERAVRRAAARCQAILSGGVFLVFFLAAPALAALLREPALAGLLRLAFVDILGMGAYAYYRGVLNGKRAFRQLSSAILAYGLTKLAFSSLLVYGGLGVEGALLGNIASSLGALAVAYLWTRRHPPPPVEAGRAVGGREIAAFVLPAMGFTLASNLLLGIDLMGVQVLVSDADQVGYYGAAVQLADAPRLVLLAFSFTLLPSLSHAIAARDLAQTRRTLRQVIRLLALAILPILALVTATAEPLVAFLYSAPYRPAAPFLSVLIFTYAAYSVYITLVTTLLAENRPGRALAIPLALLPVTAATIALSIARWGALGAAWASLLNVGLAALVVVAYVVWRYRPGVDLRSLARIGLASAGVWLVARWWSPSGLALPVAYAVLGALFLAVLLALGEVRVQDLPLARRRPAEPNRQPEQETH